VEVRPAAPDAGLAGDADLLAALDSHALLEVGPDLVEVDVIGGEAAVVLDADVLAGVVLRLPLDLLDDAVAHRVDLESEVAQVDPAVAAPALGRPIGGAPPGAELAGRVLRQVHLAGQRVVPDVRPPAVAELGALAVDGPRRLLGPERDPTEARLIGPARRRAVRQGELHAAHPPGIGDLPGGEQHDGGGDQRGGGAGEQDRAGRADRAADRRLDRGGGAAEDLAAERQRLLLVLERRAARLLRGAGLVERRIDRLVAGSADRRRRLDRGRQRLLHRDRALRFEPARGACDPPRIEGRYLDRTDRGDRIGRRARRALQRVRGPPAAARLEQRRLAHPAAAAEQRLGRLGRRGARARAQGLELRLRQRRQLLRELALGVGVLRALENLGHELVEHRARQVLRGQLGLVGQVERGERLRRHRLGRQVERRQLPCYRGRCRVGFDTGGCRGETTASTHQPRVHRGRDFGGKRPHRRTAYLLQITDHPSATENPPLLQREDWGDAPSWRGLLQPRRLHLSSPPTR